MKKPTKKKRKKGSRKKAVNESKPKAISKPKKEIQTKPRELRIKTSQTPSKKESERKEAEKRGILKYISVAGQFLRESRTELKKVKWPTRKELLASTAMVIVLVLVVAFFLGVIDFGLIKIIKNIVR